MWLNCPSVRDLEPLAGLPQLRRLWFGAASTAMDLTPLAGLPLTIEITDRKTRSRWRGKLGARTKVL
ncbi:hypothetical protein Aab01nite_48520 [Paractinoplanes abujensis]|uniref:Uncharacterized protein n=1 Tax=Paractinoplanes abujensis TaxID=882441 RepID=A0A7W7CL57_9ACTN|nr:hypothetical protein [Actinoplanes abujensis]GID21262.1 hypothetical protein Aab01nite_48520 [Actinoplanes abujensis]